MIRTFQTRLWSVVAPAALLASAAIMTGCQEDLGSSPAAFDDAPIIAEERLDSAVDSVRRTVGDPAADPEQTSNDTRTVVEESPVTVVKEETAGGEPAPDHVAHTEPEPEQPASKPEPELPQEPPVLEWSAPLTREDGSSLADGEIKGYQLYYKLRHKEEFQTMFVESDAGTRLPLEDFIPGAYEFSITTIDTEGLESRRSEPVVVDVI